MSEYTIDRLTELTNQPEETIRMALPDRYDPDTVQEISPEDFEALLKAFGASGSQLTLGSAQDARGQQSQIQIIDAVSEIRGVQIEAVFVNDYIAINAAVEQRNRTIEAIVDQGDQRLANALADRGQRAMDGYRDLFESLDSWGQSYGLSSQEVSESQREFAANNQEFRTWVSQMEDSMGKNLRMSS